LLHSSETGVPLKKYAFFDLDHTITRQDSGMVFVNRYIKKHPLYAWRYIPALFLVILWKLKLLPLYRLKQFFFSFIKGKNVKEISEMAELFVKEEFDYLCKKGALEEINRLQQEGYTLVLASASPEFYVAFFAAKLGIDIYVGTTYELINNMYTGKIKRPDCRGAAKIDRIRKMIDLNGYSIKDAYAYSDSRADIPLLQLAANRFFVDKKKWRIKPAAV